MRRGEDLNHDFTDFARVLCDFAASCIADFKCALERVNGQLGPSKLAHFVLELDHTSLEQADLFRSCLLLGHLLCDPEASGHRHRLVFTIAITRLRHLAITRVSCFKPSVLLSQLPNRLLIRLDPPHQLLSQCQCIELFNFARSCRATPC